MKKEYTFLILFLILTIVITVDPIISFLLPASEERERVAYMHEMWEKSRVVYDQFDEMVAYCKDHEEELMTVSEMFLEQYYDGITGAEAAKIAQNNTSPAWEELSKTLSFRYPSDYEWRSGENMYYFCTSGGTCRLYIVYVDPQNEDAVYNIALGNYLCSKKEKISDYLYVCILEVQLI